MISKNKEYPKTIWCHAILSDGKIIDWKTKLHEERLFMMSIYVPSGIDSKKLTLEKESFVVYNKQEHVEVFNKYAARFYMQFDIHEKFKGYPPYDIKKRQTKEKPMYCHCCEYYKSISDFYLQKDKKSICKLCHETIQYYKKNTKTDNEKLSKRIMLTERLLERYRNLLIYNETKSPFEMAKLESQNKLIMKINENLGKI